MWFAFTVMVVLDLINLGTVLLDGIGDDVYLGPVSFGTAHQRARISIAAQTGALAAAIVFYSLLYGRNGRTSNLGQPNGAANNEIFSPDSDARRKRSDVAAGEQVQNQDVGSGNLVLANVATVGEDRQGNNGGRSGNDLMMQDATTKGAYPSERNTAAAAYVDQRGQPDTTGATEHDGRLRFRKPKTSASSGGPGEKTGFDNDPAGDRTIR